MPLIYLRFQGMTALHYAASNGHVGLVEILLKAGSDTELKTDQVLYSRAYTLPTDRYISIAYTAHTS